MILQVSMQEIIYFGIYLEDFSKRIFLFSPRKSLSAGTTPVRNINKNSHWKGSRVNDNMMERE